LFKRRFAQAITSGASVVLLFVFWMYMAVSGIGLSPSKYAGRATRMNPRRLAYLERCSDPFTVQMGIRSMFIDPQQNSPYNVPGWGFLDIKKPSDFFNWLLPPCTQKNGCGVAPTGPDKRRTTTHRRTREVTRARTQRHAHSRAHARTHKQ
jgi:hypothetical protein